MKHGLYLILIVGLLTASCQLGRHYTRPELGLPAVLDSVTTDTTSIADFRWWELYTDTTLQELIRQTLEHNKDMLAAAARLKEMAAQRRIAYADMFPKVNGQLYTDKEAENYGGDNYESTPEYSAKFIASWELDLWGNLRWARDKSMAQFVQAVENRRALQMTLVAQVAQAYFELVALDNELAIVKQTLRAREESVRLARLRFNGGLTSETAYQQAQVELARTATLVPDLERAIALKENDINFLAGRYPEKVERSHHPQDIRLPETLPAGLPSSLLERRPDVRAAEEALVAANADVGIAYTNLFPRITLTAHYGLESEEFKDFIVLYKDEQNGRRLEMLSATLNVGAEYKMPFYKRLSVGFLYSNRFSGPYSKYDGRFFVDIHPLKWFELSANYGISNHGSSFGATLSLDFPGIGIFLGTDNLFWDVTPPLMEGINIGVPYKRTNVSLNFGLTFNVSKLRHLGDRRD